MTISLLVQDNFVQNINITITLYVKFIVVKLTIETAGENMLSLLFGIFDIFGVFRKKKVIEINYFDE